MGLNTKMADILSPVPRAQATRSARADLETTRERALRVRAHQIPSHRAGFKRSCDITPAALKKRRCRSRSYRQCAKPSKDETKSARYQRDNCVRQGILA